MGHAIEPIIEPLGYDWKMGVSILTGLAAKEIVVSTMGILYQAGGENIDPESNRDLQHKISEQVHHSGKLAGEKVFTPLASFGFMIFILLYFPCVAAIAAIKKEAGWGWALFTMLYTTALAWVVAFAVYQIGSLF
jgi:ferrous iron transport protein B